MGKIKAKTPERRLYYYFKVFSFMRPYILLFIPAALMYCTQNFTSSFMSSILIRNVTAALMELDGSGVIRACLVFAGMFAGFLVVVAVGVWTFTTCVLKAERDMKSRLFRAFTRASLEESVEGHSGRGIAAINTDADEAKKAFDNTLFSILHCLSSIVLSAAVVISVDWRLGLAAIIVGGISFLIQSRFAGPLGEINKKHLTANAASVKSMSNILSGALAMRTFNMQNSMLIEFDAENRELRALSFKNAFISMWQNMFTTMQGLLSTALVFGYGGYLVATGSLDFPSLIMTLGMCGTLSSGMSGIGNAWASMQTPIAASKRVFAVLDNDGSPETKTRQTSSDKWDGRYKLSVNGVNFRYKTAETNALSDVTFEVGENEMIAFVGESGSGKSTLLRALIGMYDRGDLDIRVGNLDFISSDIVSWRKKFAYVDQSCKLFDMTIRENIRLGREGASDSDIKSAAAEAFADGFVTALESGYDTPCGEKGASLSGGQKQRLAISRALVRKAPILVFDEAASALDSESEKQVMETIKSLRKNHTILITSHNLSQITDADRIVVMDKGRVAETGTHDELLSLEGMYSKLYMKNAAV